MVKLYFLMVGIKTCKCLHNTVDRSTVVGLILDVQGFQLAIKGIKAATGQTSYIARQLQRETHTMVQRMADGIQPTEM